MSDVFTTLDILITGLKKRRDTIKRIFDYTREQEMLLKTNDSFDLRKFNNILQNKQVHINILQELDAGFQPAYERIRTRLEKNTSLYAEQIKQMQDLIREIGELGLEIQVLEERNNRQFKEVTGNIKADVKSFRTNKKSVTNYYKNYNKQQESVRDRFFDSQK